MDNAAVTRHYNERRDEGRKGRLESPIIHMRKFNNWVKTVLINLHTRRGNRVLDLCSGKGGDMNKWAKREISEYVACDTADVSIQQAASRWNEMSQKSFRPFFLVGDCFDVRLADYLEPDAAFDVVSCQFAMHYAFESEARVRQMLLNVTERLRPGGFFIGTTTDANVLVRKLRAVDDLEISNAVFKIALDESFRDKRFAADGSTYGIRYNFTLSENVEDCPEFLVLFPSLVEVAREYELELVLLSNFHDFYTEFCSKGYREFEQLFDRLLGDGNMSLDEWDAIYLYTAFAFKKVGDANSAPAPSGDAKNRDLKPILDSEIVYMAGAADEK